MNNLFFRLAVLIVTANLTFCAMASTEESSKTETIYPTQEECQQKTGKFCHFRTCDYIPPGKTLEEICGKNFTKGWIPSQTQNTAFDLSFSIGGSIFGSSFEVNISGVNIAYRETIHGGTDEVRKIERTLSPDELKDIRKTILDANLLNLQSESWDFSKPPIVTDQASYRVSLSIDGKKNSISCYITPAEIAPPSECEKQMDKLRLKLNSILGVNTYEDGKEEAASSASNAVLEGSSCLTDSDCRNLDCSKYPAKAPGNKGEGFCTFTGEKICWQNKCTCQLTCT